MNKNKKQSNLLKPKMKFVMRNFFGEKQKIKLVQIKLPNGNQYWIRPFQLKLIEKDLKYMQKCNK